VKRREFITLFAGAAAAWPLAARAQQAGKTPRVGYIRAGTPNNDPFREEFVRGMRDLGYVEGRNIAYEFRHYGDDVESISSLIGDLLSAKVDVIVAGGIPAIRAAQTATQNIPIARACRQHQGLRRHGQKPVGDSAGYPVRGRDGIATASLFVMGWPICAQRHAEEHHQQAQYRGREHVRRSDYT